MKLLKNPSGVTKKTWIFHISLGLFILTAIALLSLATSPQGIEIRSLYQTLLGNTRDVWFKSILYHIRAPRVIAAILVGWALGTAGSLYQGMLENPLADPYLLGISGGAALGATISGLYEWQLGILLDAPWTAFGAFVGASLFTALVYNLAKIGRTLTPLGLILAGVVLNAVAGAGVLFLTVTADISKIQRITYWLVGQIQSLSWPILGSLVIWIGLWTILVWKDAPYFNLIALGEDVMDGWGVPVHKLRTRWLLYGAALTSASVFLAGMVGFVGLIIPHAVRMIVGSDHRRVIPFAGILGAALVTSADTVSRTLWSPIELPVGVLTATLAGPYFLWLLRKSLRRAFTP